MRAACSSFCLLLSLTLTGFLGLSGCNKAPPPITKRTYTIPTVIVKQQVEQAQIDKNREDLLKRMQAQAGAAKPVPQRMLAALVTQPDTDFFWTFKVQGKPAELEPIKAKLTKLLGSLEWKSKEPVLPEWQLPEGWAVAAQGDSFGRVATITLPDEQAHLKIAIAKFTNTSDWQQAALSNLNRWRNQLKLEPIDADEISKSTEKISFKGGEALLLDAEGVAAPQAGMIPPAAKPPEQSNPEQSNPDQPKPEQPKPEPAAGNDNSPPSPQEARNMLTYDVPATWKAKQASSFRVASFDVTEDGKKADVALSVFSTKSPEMGKVLPNVNRWRGELGLKPATESELPEQTSELKIAAGTATIFTATGTRQAAPASTLAAMLIRGDSVWFVKMQGDATLVSQQRLAFEEFLKSLKFNE